jgi:hypothetical protein
MIRTQKHNTLYFNHNFPTNLDVSEYFHDYFDANTECILLPRDNHEDKRS